MRVAEHEGCIYVDLCDEAWQVIEIRPDPDDPWEVLSSRDAPVKFRRRQGMRALPIPRGSRSIDELKQYVNTATKADFTLVVCHLTSCYRTKGTAAILNLLGKEGSAKTTVATVLRRLVDPSGADTASLPKSERDLAIAANNSWLMSYNNISSLPDWLSDAICRLASGTGFRTRALYSDDEERIFRAKRPFVLTGISEFIKRTDLVSRTMAIELKQIPEGDHVAEEVFWARFEEAYPYLLGSVLSVVAHGLAHEAEVKARGMKLPRLADFGTWGMACETAFTEPGSFMAAFQQNRAQQDDFVIEAEPVAAVWMEFMDQQISAGLDRWEGTPTELWNALNDLADEKVCRRDGWPRAAQSLSGKMARLQTTMEKKGFFFQRSNSAGRRITMWKEAPQGSGSYVRSVQSFDSVNSCGIRANGTDGNPNATCAARTQASGASEAIVREKPQTIADPNGRTQRTQLSDPHSEGHSGVDPDDSSTYLVDEQSASKSIA